MASSIFKNLGAAAFFAIAVVSATAACGGTITHGDFETSQVLFRDVTEFVSGTTGLFIPPDPVPRNLGSTNELAFSPGGFVNTDENVSWAFKSLSSKLTMFVGGKTVPTSGGNVTAYELQNLTFKINGSYNLFASFMPGAAAQVQMNPVPLSIKVTGVNWMPYTKETAVILTGTMAVTPSNILVHSNESASGSWGGTYAINATSAITWDDLRKAAGIGPTDSITEVMIQAEPVVYAASSYGSASVSVSGFDIQTTASPVAVPEPPTIILAGLGAVAVVANGYRRKKQRRNAEAEMPLDEMEEAGAIALTA